MSGDLDTTFGGWRACDACGEAGLRDPSEGALSVAIDQLEERRAELRTQEEAERGGEQAGPLPGLVPWDWGHRDCFPDRQPPYLIEGERMDTLPEMMARTLQLLDEDWFLETAWEDAVRRFYSIPFE
ncbi:MAG: hypothetical protein GEU80_09075 [Dehalococcoidia bacterium]|nr:hypothetical protein [Dehalococcoidia bacterium]